MNIKIKLFLCVFIFFLGCFILISSGRFGGDGLDNYLTAESLVLDGDCSIYDRPFGIEEMKYQTRGVVGVEGKRYAQYGISVAIFLVPLYFIGHMISGFLGNIGHDYVTQLVVSFFNPLVLAAMAVLLFNLLMKLGYSYKIGFLTTLIYSLCTMNIVYARSGFTEPLVALLVLIGAISMLDYSKKGKAFSLFLTAFAIGYTMYIKKNSFILFPAFGIYAFFLIFWDKEKSFKDKIIHLTFFTVPFIFAGIAILLQNKVLFGGMLSTEHGTVNDLLSKVRTDGYPGKGIYYYLISSGKGYLIYNIALFLGLFAARDFIKRHKAYAIFVFGLILTNLIFYSFIFVRGSLFSWGPRYLFPTLPLFAILLAEFMVKKNNFQRKILVGCLAVLGFLIQLPNFFISFSNYIFFVKDKLGLEEFLINFMPELSPIKGTWMLFLSLFNRFYSGNSMVFSYNPDLWFFQTKSYSLAGYDSMDMIWTNIIKVSPTLVVPVCISLTVICGVVAFSLFYFIKKVNSLKNI